MPGKSLTMCVRLKAVVVEKAIPAHCVNDVQRARGEDGEVSITPELERSTCIGLAANEVWG